MEDQNTLASWLGLNTIDVRVDFDGETLLTIAAVVFVSMYAALLLAKLTKI